MSRGVAAKAASLADDGALGLFFLVPSEIVVVCGMGVDVEGVGGILEAGLLSWGLATVLPLSFPLHSPLFAPFAQGHWCHFMFL
jgi:hypothetical protein